MKKTSTFFQLTQKQFNLSITIVLLLTVLLRFYQLGQIPHGMTWDEAAIGYNGFAIFNTRRDEWLTRLPISFWSFGDYKAPLAIYLNGIFTHFFGMSLWSVRLPFALAGVGSVLGLIFLTQLLAINSNEKPERARLLSIMAGILLMFSPWHHHFSRIGFESGIALMFFIWGIYFFYHALIIKFSRQRFAIFTLSILNFVASIYTYHSAKITVPLTVLFLVIWRRRELKIYWRSFLMAGVIGLLTLYFFIHDALFGKGLERAGTLIFAQSNSWWQTIRLTLTNFKVHLSTSFLLQGATTTLRHGDGQWGVLFPTTFILIILGLWYLFWNKGKKAVLGISGLAIMILGILPAALGSEVPHSNRSLLALPGFIFLVIFSSTTPSIREIKNEATD